jgi:amidohydrolase
VVELGGTVRTLDLSLWDEIPFLLENLTEQIVAPTGAKVSVRHQRGIPPVINDPGVVDVARRAVTEYLGPEAVAPTDTSMGAEDFSRYLEDVPGALLRLGAEPAQGICDLHSSGFVFEEAALETGVMAGAATVLRLLRPR